MKFDFGAERLALPGDASRDDRIARSEAMLARALNLGTTVAFVGAGCSAALGYDTWLTLAKWAVAKVLQKLEDSERSRTEVIERLRSVEKGLGRESTSSELLFTFGLCERALAGIEDERGRLTGKRSLVAKYRSDFASRFTEPQSTKATVDNPYEPLLNLGISRFITSNYDCEIEKAYAEKQEPKLNWKRHFGIGTLSSNSPHRSFTQEFEKPAAAGTVCAGATNCRRH